MYSSSLSCFLIILSSWTVRFGYHDYTSSGAGLPSSPVRLLFLPFFFFNSQRRKKCFGSSCQCLVTPTPFCPPHPLSFFFLLPVTGSRAPASYDLALSHTPDSLPTPWKLYILISYPVVLRAHTLAAATDNPCEAPAAPQACQAAFHFPSHFWDWSISLFFSCKLSSLVQRSLSIFFGFSQNLYSESCKVS